LPPAEMWVGALLWATLYSAVPILLAAMGGVLSERSGVANIALEGFLLTGAFVGVWAGQTNALVGVAAAVGAGAAMGLLHAIFVDRLRMDHIISGLAINLLAAGGTRFLAARLFPDGTNVPMLPRAPFLAVALLLPFALTLLLYRTRFGVGLRAVGENPATARGLGIASDGVRAIAVAVCGALAALGGAYLSLADAGTFSRNMSAGKGYIALAAVIFGRWKPVPTAVGALFFGLVYAIQTQVQIGGKNIRLAGITWTSAVLLDCLPYAVTIIALISFAGRSVAPAALGKVEPEL
jgi:ABC-type uncharacterized transport system permease subunit